MNLPHPAQVKQQIVAFTEKAVAQFLQQHPRFKLLCLLL